MKTYYPVLLCQLCAGFFSQPGYAAEPAPPTQLEEIVVTAGRTEEKKKEVSSHLTVIAGEELRQSASRNVGELLAEKGIGHIQQYPGNLIAVGLRGFRTDSLGNDLQGHVLILLDGRRAGTGNAAKILTKNIERIEVIRGPGAVQYGSSGMGGVVNIITRRGHDNSGFVESGIGSFGSAEGSIGGTIKEKGFDFAGVYTRATRDDYRTGAGKKYNNTGIDYENGASANIGYSFSDNNRLGLIYTGFAVEDAGSPSYLSKVDTDDTTTKSNYSVDAHYHGSSQSGKHQWLSRYFFGQDENSWLDGTASNPDGWDNGLGSKNKTEQRGAQAQLSTEFGNTAITTGLDWLHYDVKNSWSPQSTSYANPAAFLLGKAAFLEKHVVASFGLRYDWYLVEVNEPVGREEEQGRLTPKIGLAWMITDGLKLRSQYAQGFTMPSANQMAADFHSFGSRIVGNPDLDPEKSTTYEGGMEYSRNSLNGALTYFHSEFEDKITIDYQVDGSSTWKNHGEATIAGLEGELSYDIGEALSSSWEIKPHLNLTYLTRFEDRETGNNLQYVSAAHLAGGLVVGNGKGSFCRLNAAYSSSQDIRDWESGLYPAPLTELDETVVTSLSAAYRFLSTERYGTFTLRGELRNLFDEEYAYVKGYPMPGRSFFVGLRWDY
ncbi:MAG: TonB-dependent receptor [Proteobacteria bacterium]|nr:TonB-dependent receptor [Pseudomonadota bacterium]